MNNILNDNTISSKDIYFFRQRQKNKVFQSVLSYFAKQAEFDGLTKTELAERLHKNKSQITRWFSGPGNWTLDTISDLLLAMEAEMEYSIVSFDRPDTAFALFDISKEAGNPIAPSTSRTDSSTSTYINVNCNGN